MRLIIRKKMKDYSIVFFAPVAQTCEFAWGEDKTVCPCLHSNGLEWKNISICVCVLQEEVF